MRAPPGPSPLALVHETLPREGGRLMYGWRVLVAAFVLSKSRSDRVEAAVGAVLERWPTPDMLGHADDRDVAAVIARTGLQNEKARKLREMSAAYSGEWVDVATLPHVGPYAALCWRIFVERELPDEEPEDRWLAPYWRWAMWKIGLGPVESGDPKQGPITIDTVVGDAVITANQAARFCGFRTKKVIVDAFWRGELAGRMIAGQRGLITTYAAVLDWARDDDGRRRRQSDPNSATVAAEKTRTGGGASKWTRKKRRA